jgi:hypothetical protein
VHAIAAQTLVRKEFAAKIQEKFPFAEERMPPSKELKPGHVIKQVDKENKKVILHVVTKFKSWHKIANNPNQFLKNFVLGLKGLHDVCV